MGRIKPVGIEAGKPELGQAGRQGGWKVKGKMEGKESAFRSEMHPNNGAKLHLRTSTEREVPPVPVIPIAEGEPELQCLNSTSPGV